MGKSNASTNKLKELWTIISDSGYSKEQNNPDSINEVQRSAESKLPLRKANLIGHGSESGMNFQDIVDEHKFFLTYIDEELETKFAHGNLGPITFPVE